MSALNMVALNGRIGNDIEVKDMGNNRKVVNLRIAHDAGYMKDGAYVQRTHWFNTVAYGALAEKVIAKIARKGDLVNITGVLVSKEWEQDGKKHYGVDIEIKDIQIVSGAKPKAEAAAPADDGDDIPM